MSREVLNSVSARGGEIVSEVLFFLDGVMNRGSGLSQERGTGVLWVPFFWSAKEVVFRLWGQHTEEYLFIFNSSGDQVIPCLRPVFSPRVDLLYYTCRLLSGLLLRFSGYGRRFRRSTQTR